jgi:predicted dehydrogenase
MSIRKRFVQVGLGSRSYLYSEALVEQYRDTCELVGLCDTNEGRLRQRIAWAGQFGVEVPGYRSEEFERMIAECRPDTVIVTSVDATHDDYTARAMELGCDVISEKPMATTAEKCQRILDAQRLTGKTCRVTFNYRYSPPRTQMKSLMMSGVIGEVLSVDFHWLLDIHHGADYFRRWHRYRENSGGLLVHKATHHFDIMNWWLDTVPESVVATGQRRFYTPKQAEAYGLTDRSERCLDCPAAGRCHFYLDLRQYDELRLLYLENEQYDGYYRDQCVFSGKINIEDSMGLLVEYRNGVKMTYSLNAFMPWEGYIVAFNGTKGRLEHHCEETVYISGDGSVPGALRARGTTIHVYPHFEPAYEIEVWRAEGGHGGGDPLLLENLFGSSSPKPDPYRHAADHRAGAYSILTGIAANRSMQTGQRVRINDLVHGLED